MHPRRHLARVLLLRGFSEQPDSDYLGDWEYRGMKFAYGLSRWEDRVIDWALPTARVAALLTLAVLACFSLTG